MSEPTVDQVLTVLRRVHERFVETFARLGDDGVTLPSYDDDWSVAQVASHLGSGTEIFRHYLDAGVNGGPAPGDDINTPIWDAWNAKEPTAQVADAIAVVGSFLEAVEQLDADQRDGWRAEMFGTQQTLGSFLRMRLSEQTLHTWDVTVAVDPSSTLEDEAAGLVADNLGTVVAWAGRPSERHASVEVRTTHPERAYHLDLGPSGVSLSPSLDDTSAAELVLPAEAFVRLVYGRLDPDHTPAEVTTKGVDLDLLRGVFPGL
jgi:uncharacterized protein (TIGR03083 family)